MEHFGAGQIRRACKLLISWSGRPDSNRRRPAWEAGNWKASPLVHNAASLPPARRFPVLHACSTCVPCPTRDASILFLMFPVFLVVEDIVITRPLRPYGSCPEIQ